jgi:hypothetical protein
MLCYVLLEQPTSNRQVEGSIPSGATIFRFDQK